MALGTRQPQRQSQLAAMNPPSSSSSSPPSLPPSSFPSSLPSPSFLSSSSSTPAVRAHQRVILELGNDPHSERIRSNRVSAQKSREKKKREFQELQEKVTSLLQERATWKKERADLKLLVTSLTSENLALRRAAANDLTRDLSHDLNLDLDLDLMLPKRKKSRSSSEWDSSSSPSSSSPSSSSSSFSPPPPSSSTSSPLPPLPPSSSLPAYLPLLPASFTALNKPFPSSSSSCSSPCSSPSFSSSFPSTVPEVEEAFDDLALLRSPSGVCHAGEASPESVTVPEVCWNPHENMTNKPAALVSPLPLEVFSWLLLLWITGLKMNLNADMLFQMFLPVPQGAFMAETCASIASWSLPRFRGEEDKEVQLLLLRRRRSSSSAASSPLRSPPWHSRGFSHTKDPPTARACSTMLMT